METVIHRGEIYPAPLFMDWSKRQWVVANEWFNTKHDARINLDFEYAMVDCYGLDPISTPELSDFILVQSEWNASHSNLAP